MGGSVSTLAPLFGTALATRDAHATFLVGLAAAVGAGISMAFAEALSDDGSLTGRGNPISEAVSTNSGPTAATSLPIFDPVRPLRAPGAAFARVPMLSSFVSAISIERLSYKRVHTASTRAFA